MTNFTPEMHEAAKAQKEFLHSAKPDELISKAGLDLSPAQHTMVVQRLLEMPVTARNRYLRAMKGKAPVAAILSFCYECVGWARKEVELCTSLGCPLFPYRPFTEADDA